MNQIETTELLFKVGEGECDVAEKSKGMLAIISSLIIFFSMAHIVPFLLSATVKEKAKSN